MESNPITEQVWHNRYIKKTIKKGWYIAILCTFYIFFYKNQVKYTENRYFKLLKTNPYTWILLKDISVGIENGYSYPILIQWGMDAHMGDLVWYDRARMIWENLKR